MGGSTITYIALHGCVAAGDIPLFHSIPACVSKHEEQGHYIHQNHYIHQRFSNENW